MMIENSMTIHTLVSNAMNPPLHLVEGPGVRSPENAVEMMKLTKRQIEIRIFTAGVGMLEGLNGWKSESIGHKIQRGRAAGFSNLLAGIALVEVEWVHMPTLENILADLSACHEADGLVLS